MAKGRKSKYTVETATKIFQLHNSGMTMREIAQQISTETGISISHVTVKNVIEQAKISQGQLMQRDSALTMDARKQLDDVADLSKKMHILVMQMLNGKTSQEFKLRIMDRALKFAQIMDNKSRDFKNMTFNQQVNITTAATPGLEGAQAFVEAIQDLEAEGKIIIIDPHLKKGEKKIVEAEVVENVEQNRSDEETTDQGPSNNSDDEPSV